MKLQGQVKAPEAMVQMNKILQFKTIQSADEL